MEPSRKVIHPGLTELDRECIQRLIKAGLLDTATKIYRFACECSALEAKMAIERMVPRR